MKTAYLWRPLVSTILTVLIFAKREWSVCGSMEIDTSQEVAISREALAGRFAGSRLEVVVSQGVKGAATKFNTDTSTARAISVNKRRTITHDSVQINPINPNAEVEILIAFKSGITSDPLGVLNNWRGNDSHPCGWEGVVCSNNSNRVTALNLGGLQLVGTISNLLGELLFLEQLDLSGNFLKGSIPTSLTNCSNLLHVNMSFNTIIGDIPHLVGRLANLQTLDLFSNNLTGEIPDTLGNCSSLRHLDLGENYLSGGIPMNMGHISNLNFFSLPYNFFSGDIPRSILNITSLSYLDVQVNTLTGTIPQDIGLLRRLTFLGLGRNEFKEQIIPRSITNLTSLQRLFMEECELIGSIPHDIGTLISLTKLYLFSNSLTGVFPSSLSNCSLLQLFLVGDNPFDRQVFPPWIGSLRNLAEAYIANTNLEGEIPEEIGQLSHLYAFEAWANSLTGRIPPSLGNCSLIYSFDVSNNSLTGEIPPELGSLPLVEWFEVGLNLFAPGPFPPFIYNFTLLSRFGLAYNKFDGSLDGDFGRFQRLVYFEVSNNNFEGPIPDSISNCSTLGYLALEGNSLTGEIPPGLSNLSNLLTLELQNNNFHGRIPGDFMRSFQLLGYLDLSGNNLEGNIPTDIGKLVNVQNLNMSGNSFVGILPSSLGNCTQLLSLDLSKNKLSRSIPGDAFASLTSLTTVDLAQNIFSGLWPSQFGILTKLQVLNMSTNNLSGSIPLSLGGCFSLNVLDLSLNNFTGPIPQDLDLLTKLTTFNASYNNFDGPVPDLGVFKTNLTAASFLGNPALCGIILGPQRQCPNAAAPLTRRSHCRGFKCTYVWIPLVAIVGTIVVVGVSFAIFRYSRAKKDNVQQKLVMYTVNPGMMFTESDIFTVIDSGEHNVIGVGAKSIVYRALSREGETVAIKVFREIKAAGHQDEVDKERWEKELESEAHTLGQLRHRNIIKIFSLCFSLDVKAIILEYMAKGSLHALLHTNGPSELTWAQRFKMLLGVTHGMVYLHHEFPSPIIHRDLKPSNILLDEDLEPKLCDFGISRFVTNVDGEATASTFCGTFGYMPPEYGMEARLSTKGDVYSYGVVLLELLTAKECTQANSMNLGQNDGLVLTAKECTQANSMNLGQNDGLVGVVTQSYQESAIKAFELLDPTLKTEAASSANSKEQMMLTMRVGLSCTSMLPQNRPSIRIVLEMLLGIQELGQGEVHLHRNIDDLIQEEVVTLPSDYDVE